MDYKVEDPNGSVRLTGGRRLPNGVYKPGDEYYDLAREGYGNIRWIEAIPEAPKKAASQSSGGES